MGIQDDGAGLRLGPWVEQSSADICTGNKWEIRLCHKPLIIWSHLLPLCNWPSIPSALPISASFPGCIICSSHLSAYGAICLLFWFIKFYVSCIVYFMLYFAHLSLHLAMLIICFSGDRKNSVPYVCQSSHLLVCIFPLTQSLLPTSDAFRNLRA